MIERFQVSHPLYPMISIAAAVLTLIGGLLLAKSIWGTVFVAAVFFLLCCFGYGKVCLKILPVLILYLAVFSLIFWFAGGGNGIFVWQMANRLAAVGVAVIPGLSMPAIRLTRCLTELHCPRLATLGMLITMSFIPVLGAEMKQIRSAMKTRGVTSVWNLTVFYRAFLIPLLVRMINISDTLALSVETRGFVAEGVEFTVYRPVDLRSRDIFFSAVFLAVLVLGVTAMYLLRSGVLG